MRIGIRGLILGAICLTALPMVGNARAQDAKAPDGQWVPPEVVNQKPGDTIPLGTKISTANWQQYAEFMPWAIRGVLGRAMGAPIDAPDGASLTVGPTTNLPLPKLYVEDTEKYAGQAKLVPVPGLTYALDLKTYTAGEPFPNPQEPNAGYKIAMNIYYEYKPAIEAIGRSVADPANATSEVDRYGNVTVTNSLDVVNKLQFVSDPGFPAVRIPGEHFKSENFEVVAPEEAKYTAELILDPSDPMGSYDVYVYVPSLRRSLRLTSNARCAPALGTDLLTDDLDGGVYPEWPKFEIKYYGVRKILTFANMNEKLVWSIEQSTLDQFLDLQHGGWPKVDIGQWELRDMNIIGAKRISPDASSYCYGMRVVYADALWNIPWNIDLFDREGRVWKGYLQWRTPHAAPWGEQMWGDIFNEMVNIYDAQNRHDGPGFTFFNIDSQVPEQYQDLKRYATPTGLDEISK